MAATGRTIALAALLVFVGCLCVAQAQKVSVEAKGKVFNGVGAAVAAEKKNGIADAVGAVAGKVNDVVSGLVGAAAGVKVQALTALLSPLKGTASTMLASLDAVRDAAEVSLTAFFGLLLDNTKELRNTLEDGHAIIDIVRTLRGAECEDAKFTPPSAKPAKIEGPGGSLKITTGSCSLTRSADPLKEEFALECKSPGVVFDAKVPRYTSRFVSAAEASSEECKVSRKYGVESEVVVTLFNAADFFAAATDEDVVVQDVEVQEVDEDGNANSESTPTGLLGLRRGQTSAGWFNTLFPFAAGKLGGGKGGKRVSFLPTNIKGAVEKAIREATVELTLDYKPFTLKQDLIKSAQNVADALSDTFEVRQKLYKVWKDDLADWVDPEKRAEISKDLNFRGNLRASMAKYNVTNLFDSTFTKTAASLMANTRLGSKVAGAANLLTERPLRTLLSKAREGAGQPVSVKLEAGVDEAVSTAINTLKGVVPGAGAAALPSLNELLSAPRKGSLLELLIKGKGTRGHMQELQKVVESIGEVTAQLANMKQGGVVAGLVADVGTKLKSAAGDKVADKDVDKKP